jgi:hypothetical protein
MNKIDWDWLGKNRGAIDLMKKNLDRGFWHSIGENEHALDLIEHPRSRFWGSLEWNTNPRAIKLLEDRLEKGYHVCWTSIARNPGAIHLIEQNMDKMNENYQKGGDAWRILSRYGHGIHLLEQNPDKIHWRDFNAMNPFAIRVLEKYPERIDWQELSHNKHAVPLLEKNLDKVCWGFLCFNKNAVHILEQHPDKIKWSCLSRNPNAGHLLEKNLDKKEHFYWDVMGLFDYIYEIDYKYLEERCDVYKEELIKRSMCPRRIEKYGEAGYELEEILDFI